MVLRAPQATMPSELMFGPAAMTNSATTRDVTSVLSEMALGGEATTAAFLGGALAVTLTVLVQNVRPSEARRSEPVNSTQRPGWRPTRSRLVAPFMR
jgi:hypothetical protein